MSEDDSEYSLINRIYTKSEVQKAGPLYTAIVSSHKECNGTGMSHDDINDEITDCDCMKVFRYAKDLLFCNIPQRHWDIHVDETPKHFSETPLFKQTIESLQRFSQGLILLGLPETGKTRALSYISKRVLSLGMLPIYFRISDLESMLRFPDDHENLIMLERINSIDVILFDDIDKFERGKDDWAANRLERFISKLVDAGKCIFATATMPSIEDVENNVPKIGSLFAKAVVGSAILNIKNTKIKQFDFLSKQMIDEANKNSK